MILTLIGWIGWMLIGGVVGILANRLTSRRLLMSDILISILGAVIGGLLFSQLGLPGVTDFNPLSLLAALIGAVLAVFLYKRYSPVIDSRLEDEATIEHPESRPLKTGVWIGHRCIPFIFVIALIGLLLLLDVMLLRLRIPDLTTLPPPFGNVSTYQNADGQLNYLVYAPPSYSPGTPLPLVVLLHGCMQDPTILEAASGMRDIADTNNFLLVYPQQNAASSPHRCWNWYDPANQQRNRGEPSLIVGIVNKTQQDYDVDARRIYLAGISSGGAMTSTIASCYPDVFAAAAIHSGMGYESAISVFQALVAPLRGSQVDPETAGQDAYACSENGDRVIPVLILHGMADTVVFPVNSDHTLRQITQFQDFADDSTDNNSIVAIPTRTEPQQIEDGYSYRVEDFEYAGELLLQRYSVDGLWHMWSGGTGIVPLSDPKAPNASQIFWDFFDAHPMP